MKKFLLVALALSFAFSGSSQFLRNYRLDYGVNLGGANYLGEMGGKEQARRDFVWDMKLNQTRLSTGAFLRYRFNEVWGINTSLTYGRLQGDDALSTNSGRVGRNLSFRNDIVELASRAEVYVLRINDVGRTGRYLNDFRLFAFGGLGAFYSNPKAQYNGEWYSLRKLKTEGQEKPYSAINMSIPTGIGFFYTINRRYRIGWEFGWRTTFTDYIDDVSTVYASPEDLSDPIAIALANRHNELNGTEGAPHHSNYEEGQKRGDASHNDTYMFTNLSFSYVIRGRVARVGKHGGIIWGPGKRGGKRGWNRSKWQGIL